MPIADVDRSLPRQFGFETIRQKVESMIAAFDAVLNHPTGQHCPHALPGELRIESQTQTAEVAGVVVTVVVSDRLAVYHQQVHINVPR